MSRLPDHANLEHLRKQAKKLLAELQRADPSKKLADALHALAREYGFASWASLKAHVKPAPPRPNAASNPFGGVWIANVPRSKPHPANPFRSATVTISVDGERYTIAHVVVGSAGREEGATHVLEVDGQERAADASGRYFITARRLAPRAFEAIVKTEGVVAGRTVYEVSPDGSTLTVSARDARSNAAGWQSEFDQVIVFERTNASDS